MSRDKFLIILWLCLIAVVASIIFVSNAKASPVAETKTEFSVLQPKCSDVSGSSMSDMQFTDLVRSDLCVYGTPSIQIESFPSYWKWHCYGSTEEEKSPICRVDKQVEIPFIEPEPETEAEDPTSEEVVEENIERTPEPIETSVGHDYPMPFIGDPAPTSPIVLDFQNSSNAQEVEEDNDDNGDSKKPKLSKREIYERFCHLPKEDMPKEWRDFSDREVYACCTGNPKSSYVTQRRR